MPGDHFHNGDGVLGVVTSWHLFLRQSLRKSDTITARVLDLIDNKMLLGSSSSRIGIDAICGELKQILEDSKADQRMEVSAKVLALLLEIDQEALNKFEPRLLDSSMVKTAYRSSCP